MHSKIGRQMGEFDENRSLFISCARIGPSNLLGFPLQKPAFCSVRGASPN
jgi:hypothetical protein